MSTKVLVISDLHTGSIVGLTPPDYHHLAGDSWQVVEDLWNIYAAMVDRLKPIDVLIVNGDSIDGKSSRTGSTDVITAKIFTQIDWAAECIDYVGAKNILMTYGTPYHVGAEEDFEAYLAAAVGAEIRSHCFAEIGGVNFSIKHKIGSSTIPHGRHTAIAREKLWDREWAETKEQHPTSNVLIRSHVHYFGYAGSDSWLGITTPALQGLGSHYGARMCAGVVDFGVVWFECEKGAYKWGWDIALPEVQKEDVLRL